jgi:hypothetical protein
MAVPSPDLLSPSLSQELHFNEVQRRILWLDSPLGHVSPCTLPLSGHQHCPLRAPINPKLFVSSLAICHCLRSSYPQTHSHDFSPPCSHTCIYQPLKGPNLATLLLSPIDLPWFSDRVNGNWWVGFQGSFCFHITPCLCKLPARLTACWFLALTVKMEVTSSTKTSADSQWTTQHYIPEDWTPHTYRCENLKSYITLTSFFS